RSDINGDGIVNWPDYSLLIKYYRKIATLITDINEDYKVDIYDAIEVAKAIGQKPRYKPRADVNRDKKIDAEDFKLVVMDFGKSKEDITSYLLPTDLDRDKIVDYNDLLIIAKAFNSASTIDPRADVNLNGYINSYDANLVIRDMIKSQQNETYGEFSIADINRDGIVNNTDLLILKRDYLSTSQTRADINGDGIVNALDFSILAMYWLKEALLITDINSDYKVDIYDAVEVAKVIGQKPSYKPRADVNRDTKIDVEDFKLVVMDFGKSRKDITTYLFPTDLNRDKKVDYNDLLIVAKVCYNHSYIDPRADVNLNYHIDSNDANLVIRDMIKSQQNETYGEFSIADINRDGVVNITDYSILIKNYGNLEEKRADINGDEIVNATDYSILSKYWLKKATLITDINGDYKVNVVDVVEVAKAIGKEPSYRPRADINRDGKIDVEDFKLVVIDFGKTTNNITKYLLPTDLNRDSTVNITDIEIVKSAMDISPIKDQRADVNFDGVVNFYDLNLVQRDVNAKSIKNWTYMVYLDADNNLESAGIDDFLEMSAVGSAKEVNILVQMDRIRRHDSSHDDWTTTKRYYVEKGMVPNVTNALADIGEANMGDPNTLVNFVKFGIENYPAEHYVVVLWNHGGGWSYGVCVDDTDGHDMLSSDELKTAFIQIRDYLGKPIDIIGYDACLMGNTEIMYQHKATADYVIASAEVEGWDGWEYTGILSDLVAKPSMKPAELGKVHIDRNIPTNDIKTMIFIDNKIFDYPLMEALNNLSQKLRHVAGSYKGGITSARDTATGFYYPNLKDIYSLVQSLEKNVLDNSVKEAARKVIEILNAFQ
ncbi:MAG: dockerin type I domain-containing protein, partial [Candidatus Thermoplasmatota archaeon]